MALYNFILKIYTESVVQALWENNSYSYKGFGNSTRSSDTMQTSIHNELCVQAYSIIRINGLDEDETNIKSNLLVQIPNFSF